MQFNVLSDDGKWSEVDCPYFLVEWLEDHPDFPLSPQLTESDENEDNHE